MSLPANKKNDITSLGDVSGGLNINDPSTGLAQNEVAGALNVIFLKRGFKRWPGCENLTVKDACNDYLRGLFTHSTIAGDDYLYTVFGGKVYSVDPVTGVLSAALYDLTGTGEAWGGSHWGTYYLANGAKVVKIEGATAYSVGIAAPTAGSVAASAGAGLADGAYSVYIGYARKVSGLNVLYSQGKSLGTVTLGGGNNRVSITGFTNSADAQVNNKVVWMTDAAGTTLYFYAETGNNTDTSIIISSDATKNNALIYDVEAQNNGLPGAFTFLHVFSNRIWGLIGNKLYYSKKATTSYDLEKFPAINVIEYPYQLTGIFSIGEHLYLNTASHGILIQPSADVGAKYEHVEQRYSFRFMRTVADWNGGKIGITNDGLMWFNGTNFEPYDYGYNVRPALAKIWRTSATNTQPCGFTYRRDNRIEYVLSFCDNELGVKNNNRQYVLNLSQVFFQDAQNYRTPWEVVDRGFNYVAVNGSNVAYFGQSYEGSSQIYNEVEERTTQTGIYNAIGDYLATATDMTATVIFRTIMSNLFTKMIIEDIAMMLQITSAATVTIAIADDPDKILAQDTDLPVTGSSLWDSMQWDYAQWSVLNQERVLTKGNAGIFGYSWYTIFNQVADDPNLLVTQIDVLHKLETGRGI